MNDCIFCKIIKGEVPCSKVYEDESVIAFMDIKPVNTGHVLVIPKHHVQLITDLDEETSSRLIQIAKKVNAAIRKSEVKAEAINFFLADGEAAGQEVFHVHLHVIPRYTGDGFGFKFPDSYNQPPSRQDIESAAEGIRAGLK